MDSPEESLSSWFAKRLQYHAHRHSTILQLQYFMTVNKTDLEHRTIVPALFEEPEGSPCSRQVRQVRYIKLKLGIGTVLLMYGSRTRVPVMYSLVDNLSCI
jgi:hypothetical protein